MKEITRIITVEITEIVKLKDNEEYCSKDEAKRRLTEKLYQQFACDNVNVTNVQDFIRDEEQEAHHE